MSRTTDNILKDADGILVTAVLDKNIRNLIAELSAKLREMDKDYHLIYNRLVFTQMGIEDKVLRPLHKNEAVHLEAIGDTFANITETFLKVTVQPADGELFPLATPPKKEQ